MARRNKWKELFTRRKLSADAAAAAAKDKKRKLPGFKSFGRTSSTTQLVQLGDGGGTEAGCSSSSSSTTTTTTTTSTAGDEDGRIATVVVVVPSRPDDGVSALETAAPSAASLSTTHGTSRIQEKPSSSTPPPPTTSTPTPTPPSLLVPKLWYLASHMALALFPYPALYLASDRKLTSVQVGIIMALRPFVSAVFGNAFALLADATRSHRTVLLSTFVAAGIARGLVGLPSLRSFWPLLAVVLLSEAVAAPVIILADAATQQAAERARSDYGRVRLFGAVGLGAFSPLNGAIVTRFGNGAGFLAGSLAWLLSSSALTAMLPMGGLAAAAASGGRPAGRRASEAGGSSFCGHLPLPLSSASSSIPAVASEGLRRLEETVVEEEEGEEEEGAEEVEDVVVDADVGTKENELAVFSSSSPSSAPIFEIEATTTAVATAATARARLSSFGGGKRATATACDNRNDNNDDDDNDDDSCRHNAAVAAAAAALGGDNPRSTSPSSDLPHGTTATAPETALALAPRPKRPNFLVIEEAFEERQHHQQRRSSGAFSSGRVSHASSSAASSTRPLSPAAAAFPSSLSSSSIIIPTRKRASSSSSSILSTIFDAASDDDQNGVSSLPLHRKIAAVFGSPQAAVFFATAWALGYGAGTIESWLFVFLEEAPLGASKQLMGVTILVTCATEVPAFFYSGKIIERFGAARVLSVVSLVLVARLCGYWTLPSIARGRPWAVLPLETLNGITFGCGWAAGTARAASLAPPGLAATAQAAFAAVYGGLGAGLGSLAGGVVRSRAAAAMAQRGGGGGESGRSESDKSPTRWVFAAAAAVIALAWTLTALAEVLLVRRRRRRRRRSWRRKAAATVTTTTATTTTRANNKKGFAFFTTPSHSNSSSAAAASTAAVPTKQKISGPLAA